MSSISNQSLHPNQSPDTMDDMQRLAKQIEQARERLQHILLENPKGLHVVAEHFSVCVERNIDISELVNCSLCHEKVLQLVQSVQPNPRQIAGILTELMDRVASKSSHVATELSQFHFLPVFLLQAAEKTISASQENKGYRQELQQLRHSLQATRQQMVMQNRKLVAFIVRKQNTGNLNFHDVMQEGMIGLLKAVDRFDHRRDIRFSTYASYWIKQTVSRLVVRQDKIVRLPFGLAEKASGVFEIMRSHYLNENRWPSIEEIKSQCDLSEDEIKTVVSFYQNALTSTSSETGEDDHHDAMANLEQQLFQQPLEVLAEQNLSQFLLEAIESLSQREADILTMRFGLKNQHEMTLQGVAEQMQVTRERIRQIQNIALEKLRQNFGCELKLYLPANE